MTCDACGEKPKKMNKGFPKAVVEINNPETLVLLRKVVVPASMGDETTFPPAIGKYFNVLLHYDASGNNYLYSSDGIPTEIGSNIPSEVLDRINTLEDDYDDLAEDYEQLQSQVGDVSEALSAETSARENADIGLQGQIDALTVSSGVIDVLGTYQDLQNYDTTHVKEDDIIKVLQDSTHNNAMTYYRWIISGGAGSWQYVGQEGPYYTKSETETLLNNKQDEITSSNKLLSDLVDDTNQTNKFVTTSEKQTWNNKYDKPNSGIPKTDLASTVQTSLNKADTALQSISSSDVTSALGYTPYNSTNPNGYTSNVGTITGITMNGASKGTSGVVDLGTVITSHQDISGKANKISVVQPSTSTIEINSNTFYKFGEVASLNITLASITDNTIYNEYMFEFVSGTTATTLTLPSSIKWLETPTIDANKIYQCSIVDNVGLLVGVANV